MTRTGRRSVSQTAEEPEPEESPTGHKTLLKNIPSATAAMGRGLHTGMICPSVTVQLICGVMFIYNEEIIHTC